MNSRYQTPDAVKQDVHTLAEDARALLNATSEIADEKVAEARKRLEIALQQSRSALADLKARTAEGLATTDQYVRSHPYESLAAAFGLGAVLGILISRKG